MSQSTPDTPQAAIPLQLLPAIPSRLPPVDLSHVDLPHDDPAQTLQVNILPEPLETFTPPQPIKHGDLVLCQSRLGEDLHIMSSSDSLIPKVLITSPTLFQRLALLKTSLSTPLDINLHTYNPADRFLHMLGQVRRTEPYKTPDFVQSRLAHVCIQALVNADTFPMDPLGHDRQKCGHLRLALALYTSSPIKLSKLQGCTEFARLHSFQYDRISDTFQLTLVKYVGLGEPETLRKVMHSKSIFLGEEDDGVSLASLEDEVLLVEWSKSQSQNATNYIDPGKAFRYSPSNGGSEETESSRCTQERKRDLLQEHNKRKGAAFVELNQTSINSEVLLERELTPEDVFEYFRGDTESLKEEEPA